MSALEYFNEHQKSRRAPIIAEGVACAGCPGAMWRIEGGPGPNRNAIAHCTGLHKDMYDYRKAADARIAFEDWQEARAGGERPENSLYTWPVVCDGTRLAAEAQEPKPDE